MLWILTWCGFFLPKKKADLNPNPSTKIDNKFSNLLVFILGVELFELNSLDKNRLILDSDIFFLFVIKLPQIIDFVSLQPLFQRQSRVWVAGCWI